MRSILLILLLIFSTSVFSQQGPFGPRTATTSGSAFNWANASNALTDNSDAAVATLVGKKSTSNLLRLTNFGFSIPAGSVINGIKVEIRMQGTNVTCVDQTIQLRKSSGAVGTNKARTSPDWPKKAAAYVQFGGNNDLWGTTWSFSDINNSSFGIDIAAKAKKNTATARVEYVRITVYYNQTVYYSKSTGNLNLLSSWGTNTDGSGTAPTNFTNNNQVFNFRNRSNITLSANFAISGTSSRLVVGSGTSPIEFTIPSSFSYTGELEVSNNATVYLNNSIVPTLGQISTPSSGGTSTIIYGANALQNVAAKVYDNLVLSGSGTKTLTGNARAEGTLTINTGTIFSDGGYVFTAESNVINSGTHISSANGAINLEGSSAQSISGSNGTFGNIEIYNEDGISLLNNVTISGNIHLEQGILNIGNTTLTLNGTSSRVNGSFAGGINSNLVIGGTGNFGILHFDSGSPNLNNLSLNRSSNGNIELGTDLTINNMLTMNAGNITTGINNFTLGTSTSSRGTLNHNSGIVIGAFSRWFNNSTNTGSTGLFPIGTIMNYRPVTIEFTTAPTSGGRLTAQIIEGYSNENGLPLIETAHNINTVSESGVWELTPTNLNGGQFTGTFVGTNFILPSDYTTLHLLSREYIASPWSFTGNHVATSGSNAAPVLQRIGMSTFGEFGVGCFENSSLLPISLLFFRGEKTDDKVLLHWATASEINNDYFNLERSDDAVHWISIAQINGNGNTDSRTDYYYSVQKSAFSAYYRLKQTDYDGHLEYHNVIFVENDDIIPMRKLILYPNPVAVGEILNVQPQNNYEEIVSVTLNNISNGNVIAHLKEYDFQKFQISYVPNQTYLITVETTERYYSQKIMVKQ